MKHIKIYEEFKIPYDEIPHNGLEIIVNGYNFSVEGNYIPGEEPVMYYSDGSGYPGSSSEYDITKICAYDDNGEEVVIYDQKQIKNLGFKEKIEYNQTVEKYLKNEYGVTFHDIEISTIESIEDY